MLYTIYLNRRVGGKLHESTPLFVNADSDSEAQTKWAERVKNSLASHGCGKIEVPAKVQAGWKAELEPYSFSLTAIQQRK